VWPRFELSTTPKQVPEAMMTRTNAKLSGSGYEIRYQPLSKNGQPLSFPCDAEGHVQLDALSDRARNTYFYARTVVGREYAAPAVLPCDLH